MSTALVVYSPKNGKQGKKPKKNRNKNKSKTVVVVSSKPSSSHKNKPQSSKASGGDAAQYAFALRNPFSPNAIGARVPDSFAFPTATYHLRTSASITTSAGGTVEFTVLPNPCFTLIMRTGLVSGPTVFSQNPTAYYVASPTALNAVLTEYRVVSWGIRFLPKDTLLASKGRFCMALVPTTANAPSWNTLNTVSASGSDVISEYTTGTIVNSDIINLPTSRAFSTADLMRGEVQVAGFPLNPSFYDFKGTTDRSNTAWNTGQVLADEGVYNNTTGLVNATAGGRKDVSSVRGGMAILVQLNGAPANTNEFDLEIIYHLEGTPNITTSNGAVLVPSSMRSLTGSTSAVEKALTALQLTGEAVSMVANPVSTLGIAASYVAKGAQFLRRS